MSTTPKIKISHNDLAALFAQAPRKTDGTTIRSRRVKEQRPLSSTDGRRLRSKGRDRQYNTNVTSEIAELAADLMLEFDLTKAELTERALLYYTEALRSGKVQGGAGQGG